MVIIRDNPHLQWCREGLSENEQITLDDVLNLDLPNSVGEWNWMHLSSLISMDDVRSNPDLTWNRLGLSRNKQLLVDDINHLELPNGSESWDMAMISTYIDIEEIRLNPDLKWDKFWMCNNKSITMDDVKRMELYNYYGLSFSLSMNEILQNIEEGWDREGLSQNEGITVDLMHLFDEEEETYMQMKHIILILLLLLPVVSCAIIEPLQMVKLDNRCEVFTNAVISSGAEVVHAIDGSRGRELKFECYDGIILLNPNNFTIGVRVTEESYFWPRALIGAAVIILVSSITFCACLRSYNVTCCELMDELVDAV